LCRMAGFCDRPDISPPSFDLSCRALGVARRVRNQVGLTKHAAWREQVRSIGHGI